MKVVVNGVARDVPAGTVGQALEELGVDARRRKLAVAVNGEVVRRGDWATRALAEGDRIEVLTAVQGG